MVHVQTHVRRQNAHQRHVLKIQPLGHHLGAQQDGDLLFLKFSEQLFVSRAYGIRVHPQDLRSGKQCLQLLLHLLGANSHVLEGPAAVGAGLRGLFRVAAVMAHQPSVGGVIRQIDAAAGTLGHVAAVGTEQLAAVAPPVQKQYALLAGVNVRLQFPGQIPADGAGTAVPQFPAHIHQQHLGQVFLVVASAKAGKRIAALPGVVGRLHRRRGGAQHQPGILLYTSVFGDVPGMVAGGVFRFVGALLFLVQYDESDILQRRKHRRPGAQHDMGFSTTYPLVLVVSFRHPQTAVEQSHLVAEIGGKAGHHLGCQRDLRHQDHGGLAPPQQLLRQANIDQRFTASGNALQRRHAGFAGKRLPQDLLKDLLLLIIQCNVRCLYSIVSRRDAILLLLPKSNDALLLQTVQTLAAHAGKVDQIVDGGLTRLDEQLHRIRLSGGLAVQFLQRLLGAHSQRRHGDHLVPDLSIAPGHRADQAALFHLAQQRDHRLAELFFQRVGLQGLGAQQVQHVPLPLGKFCIRRFLSRLPDLPVAKPDGGRQDGVDGIVKRAEIPLAHPQGQPDLPFRDHGLGVQQLPDGLEGLLRRLAAHGEDHPFAGAIAASEGDQHPLAGLRIFRCQIVVGLVNGIGRRFHGDFRDLRHRQSLPPAVFLSFSPLRSRCRWYWPRTCPLPPR